MGDQNIKPLASRGELSRPVVEALPTKANEESKQNDSDAATVSVPRMQSQEAAPKDPDSKLESLLSDILSSPDALSAHGGLDPARVFSLLDDSDEA